MKLTDFETSTALHPPGPTSIRKMASPTHQPEGFTLRSSAGPRQGCAGAIGVVRSPLASGSSAPRRRRSSRTVHVRSMLSRSTCSSGVWAIWGRRARSWRQGSLLAKRATSVQPSFARTGSVWRLIIADRSGWSSAGAAAARHVDDLDARRRPRGGPPRNPTAGTPRPPSRCGRGRSGAPTTRVTTVGDDVARHAAVDLDRLERLAVTAPVDLGLARLVLIESDQQLSPRAGSRSVPSRLVPMWAAPGPSVTPATLIEPWHPASIAPSVGSPSRARSPDEEVGSEIEQLGEPVVDRRHLLPGVEDVGDVDGGIGVAPRRLEHHRHAALHVRRADPPDDVALDPGDLVAVDGRHGVGVTGEHESGRPPEIGAGHQVLSDAGDLEVRDARGTRPRSDRPAPTRRSSRRGCPPARR